MSFTWIECNWSMCQGCALDESGTDVAKCHRKVTVGRKVSSAIRSLVNSMGLELECLKLLYEAFFCMRHNGMERKGNAQN